MLVGWLWLVHDQGHRFPPAELSPSFCTTTFLRNCGTPAAAAAASSTLLTAANTFFPVSFAPAVELDFPLFSLDLEDRD